MKVPYYVGAFNSVYRSFLSVVVGTDFALTGSALRHFEERVESAYVEMLLRNCQREQYGRAQLGSEWCAQYRTAREAYEATYYRSR